MKYVCAHGSRQGDRKSNQDRVAIAERENAVLMVLGDGLGGYSGGELAAETLCRLAVRAFRAVKAPVIADPTNFLAMTIFQAHHAMKQMGPRMQPPIKPRTTCVVCLVQEGCAYWAHVGDSRLYHFRQGRLINRTRDDTDVDMLRERGILSEKEAVAHPDKSRLLRCLGSADPVVTLSAETVLKAGDTLLLCSDGAWETLHKEEMPRFLAHPVLEAGLADLLAAAEARHHGHSDNVTAAALRWQGGEGRAAGRAPTGRSLTARAFWEKGQKLALASRTKQEL
ncbi:MAG: serine/threonine-protein phosphatase [Gammaproteobacteria bacterium]|nr:serine/threonine-protein phosphatase [Gammaproteobacteria bacterium]